MIRKRKYLVSLAPAGMAFALVLATLAVGFPAPDAAAQKEQTAVRRTTGLPLPRFVSLKSNNVNVRRGPGQEYELAFTFVRAGLPVEITQEFDTWRKIRDSEGSEGWVFHSLLSGERTALIAPWKADGQYPARAEADQTAPVVAYLQPRVVGNVDRCTGTWCLVRGESFQGWLQQNDLWGVYPEERFEE